MIPGIISIDALKWISNEYLYTHKPVLSFRQQAVNKSRAAVHHGAGSLRPRAQAAAVGWCKLFLNCGRIVGNAVTVMFFTSCR